MTTLHEFNATRLDGTEQALSAYRDQVVLVVNTASKCGLTPHYAGLQELHEKYAGQGLVVLGFPCNQFGAQEPGTAEEIADFCSTNYGVDFPMFAKIDVNGPGAHPIYQWLRSERPIAKGATTSNETGGEIEWNFAKFLIGRDGRVIERYQPTETPAGLAADIENALAQS